MTNIELETLSAIKAACRKYMSANEPCATPDWEQRRYEIAKEILPHLLAHSNIALEVKRAVTYADALIAELQKSNQ